MAKDLRMGVPLPAPETIGEGIHAPRGVVGLMRYVSAGLVPVLWLGRRALKSPIHIVITLSCVITSVSLLFSIALRDWHHVKFIAAVVIGLAALMLIASIVAVISPGTTYVNASNTVYLRMRSEDGPIWRADSHMKTRNAQPGDAHELRVAVMRALLPTASTQNITVQLSAASKKLYGVYSAEVETVQSEIGMHCHTLTINSTFQGTTMIWSPIGPATRPAVQAETVQANTVQQ